MHATYFVPSGLVCMQSRAQCRATSPYLTIGDVRALAAGGDEIGGLTVLHQQLTGLPAAETAREICDDRSNLWRWGFRPTDFAYPYATVSSQMQALTRQCGYNSALGTGQLKGAGLCQTCALAETVPPQDPYDLRTPIEVNSVNTTWSVGTYQSIVEAAQAHGGGWVIFTIHGVCPRNCPLGVTPGILSQVASWLRGQAANGTVVRTIRQVIGGPVRPPVAGPRPRPIPSPGITNAQLAATTGAVPACFQRVVYGGTAATFRYERPAARTLKRLSPCTSPRWARAPQSCCPPWTSASAPPGCWPATLTPLEYGTNPITPFSWSFTTGIPSEPGRTGPPA